jgi:tetratricopeptide (TPR) repeat protein
MANKDDWRRRAPAAELTGFPRRPASAAALRAETGAGQSRTSLWWRVGIVSTPAAYSEAVTGLIVFAVLVWAGATGWHFYEGSLRPFVRSPDIARPHRVATARASDPAAVRRLQQVVNLLGEASTYREAKRQDWADATLRRALELDPNNEEARQLLARWAVEPAPALSAEERATREREAIIARRMTDLLGAASAFVEAGQPEAARPLLEEAMQLEPHNGRVQDLWQHLPSPG